jgi:putative flippase GtrA
LSSLYGLASRDLAATDAFQRELKLMTTASRPRRIERIRSQRRMWRPEHASLFSQGLRFAFTGCAVSAVYLLTTSALALLVGLPFQVALAIGFVVAVAMHFGMQRLFVWTDHDSFALAAPHQVSRYLLAASAQYGVTAASTSFIPAVLGLPVELVYLAIAFPVAFVNFMLFRNYIFHGKQAGTEAHGGPA